MAWMLPGVRPSMRLASMPTACTSPRALVDRDDRRLGEHDAAPAHVDQRVGRAKVDGHVAAAERAEVVEDAHCEAGRAWRDTSECARMQGDSTPHPETGRRRSASISTSSATGQADDVEEVSLDVRRRARHRPPGWRSPGAAAPLAARHVVVDRARRRARRKRTAVRACPVRSPTRVAQRQARHDVVRAPRQRAPACAPPRRRRPACRAPARRPRRACRRRAPSRPPPPRPSAPCRGCAARPARAAARQRQLVVGRLDDAELEPELREDRAALRRARRQDERHSPAGRSSPDAK